MGQVFYMDVLSLISFLAGSFKLEIKEIKISVNFSLKL